MRSSVSPVFNFFSAQPVSAQKLSAKLRFHGFFVMLATFIQFASANDVQCSFRACLKIF